MPKNKSEYWFKRRRYGWGWTPVTWQGWMAVSGFLMVVIGGVFYLPIGEEGAQTQAIIAYLLYVVLASVMLVIVGYQRGPEPRWRWGRKESDNPDEDI